MKLYVIRHGIAEETVKSLKDKDRELTQEGIEKMHKIGKGLKALDAGFDLILTSPYTRAKQTAFILAEETGYDTHKIAETSFLKPYGDWEKIFTLTKGLANIAIVGHDPMLSQIVSSLISDKHSSVSMKKGAVALVELDTEMSDAAHLLWLIPPKVFTSLI
jgi:phosphohistidine phosphatase